MSYETFILEKAPNRSPQTKLTSITTRWRIFRQTKHKGSAWLCLSLSKSSNQMWDNINANECLLSLIFIQNM